MDDKSKISQEELFAAQERLRYIKESNAATEESISLAGDLASMIQQEHDYLIGINEDKRTSSDLSREILAESQTIAKAEKEKLSLFKKGNVDEAAKLGVIIKQAKARIKEKTTLAASMKEIEEADKKRIAANEQISKLIGISASELNKSKGAATKAFLVKQGASAWGMIKNIIMETSKLISGLQKDLGITDDEAAKLQENFAKIGEEADRLGINLISVQKAFNTLNAQFGTAATVIRDDIVVETAKLMKFYEMSAESAKSFAQFSLISGKNAAVVTAEARKAVVEGEKERGVRVDIRKVLDQTGKITGQVRAQLGANPAAIAKAVTVAKQFAMELQQVAKAGIKVNIEMVPSKGYWNEVWMKKPVSMTRWNQRPADTILHEAYHSGAKWNESYFKNADFDKNLADARSELDFNKRKKAYQNAQMTLWEQSGTMIPYHVSRLVVTSSKVKNLDAVDHFSIQWHKVKVD